MGQVEPRRHRRAHPGQGRRRRRPLGPGPHARRRDQDRQQPGPAPEPEAALAGQAAPLHVHLAPLGRRDARGGRQEPRGHPGDALPRRRRRDRPADEPRPAARDPERDRALPPRRDRDLDPRRRAVRLARRGPDRRGQGDHQPSRSSTSSPAPDPRPGRRSPISPSPPGVVPDGERFSPRRRGTRRRAPSRSARGAPELADRPPDARHPALHRLGDHAVRGVLRLLLLPPRRRQRGPLAARPVRASGRGRRR